MQVILPLYLTIILQILGLCYLLRWLGLFTLRQAISGLAHGGQVRSDLSTIDPEEDPAECAVLKSGFEKLYGVLLGLRHEFVKYNAVMEMMEHPCESSYPRYLLRQAPGHTNVCESTPGMVRMGLIGKCPQRIFFHDKQKAARAYGRLMKLYGQPNSSSSRI